MTLAGVCWIATAAYGVHIAEEAAFDWVNWARSVSGLPISRKLFWTANAAVIALGAVAALTVPALPLLALAYFTVMLTNATVFHVGSFLWTHGRFSPGMLSSVLLFWPISALGFRKAAALGLLTGPMLAGSILFGLALMALPVVFVKLATHAGWLRQ